jgi:hypothetical protein
MTREYASKVNFSAVFPSVAALAVSSSVPNLY